MDPFETYYTLPEMTNDWNKCPLDFHHQEKVGNFNFFYAKILIH